MNAGRLKLRALWWIMVRAERLAHWCRARWVAWHDTRGIVVPDVSKKP